MKDLTHEANLGELPDVSLRECIWVWLSMGKPVNKNKCMA